MFKVITAVEKKDGTTSHWMRVGTAFVNRDDSINVYLDACPRTMQFQIREYDEKDLARREARGRDGGSSGGDDAVTAAMTSAMTSKPAQTDVPF
jgi:hypothetical protein